jgi:hypothetical protein
MCAVPLKLMFPNVPKRRCERFSVPFPERVPVLMSSILLPVEFNVPFTCNEEKILDTVTFMSMVTVTPELITTLSMLPMLPPGARPPDQVDVLDHEPELTAV